MKDSKFDAHEVAFGGYQTLQLVGYAVGVGVDFFSREAMRTGFPRKNGPLFFEDILRL